LHLVGYILKYHYIQKYQYIQSSQGRATVQKISRHPLKTGVRLRPQASSFQTCYGQGGNGIASFRLWYVPMRLSTTDLYKPTTSLHYLYILVKIQCHCIANKLFLRRSTDDQREVRGTTLDKIPRSTDFNRRFPDFLGLERSAVLQIHIKSGPLN
jgi:hypothetical protein